MLKIAVVIVTWNKKGYVIDLLKSIQKLVIHEFALSICVVDNASEDGTSEVIRELFPHVNVIRNRVNVGGTGGFNTGLKWVLEKSDCDYIWLLDNDVKVHPMALKGLVDSMEANDELGAVGSQMRQLDFPDVINENGGVIIPELNGLFLLHHKMKVAEFKNLDVSKNIILTHYCAAASLLVRREVVSMVGIWKDMFIHFDDVEWCLRIRKTGFKIACNPSSIIWHLSAESKPLTWIMYYDTRNYLYLLSEHFQNAHVKTAIYNFYRMSIKAILTGRLFSADWIYFGANDFMNNVVGKSKMNLSEIGEVIPWRDFMQHLELGDLRLLVSPRITTEASDLFVERRITHKIDVYACQGDFMASVFIPGSRLFFFPYNKTKRLYLALREFLKKRKRYTIGISALTDSSISFNVLCREVYYVVDGGVIKGEINTLNILKNLIRNRLRWKSIFSSMTDSFPKVHEQVVE